MTLTTVHAFCGSAFRSKTGIHNYLLKTMNDYYVSHLNSLCFCAIFNKQKLFETTCSSGISIIFFIHLESFYFINITLCMKYTFRKNHITLLSIWLSVLKERCWNLDCKTFLRHCNKIE